MNVIPAIDLQDGKCVRLYQGDFGRCTEYDYDPIELARRYQANGFTDLHVVDLDGARTGTQRNRELVSAIAEQSSLTIQLGGGIRDAETLRHWLERGVSRCIIGSRAVTDTSIVREWCAEFGAERIVLALDVRVANGSPLLATHGWTANTKVTLWQCLEDFLGTGLQHVLCTDITRDGAMRGPNVDLYRDFRKRFPDVKLQAAGGVTGISDLRRLREVGVHAAISGRALLDRRITLEEVQSFLPAA